MAIVTFKNKNITLEVEEGIKLSECIRRAKLSLETPCNCMGLCGKCKVKVSGELEEPSLEERDFLKGEKGIRLACLAKVKGDVEIKLIKSDKVLKTINRGYSIEVEVNSEIKKEILPKIDKDSTVPYEEILNKKIESLDLYNRIAILENKRPETLYGVTYKDLLLDIDEDINKVFGISIDIGTTGVSAYMVDLETGEILKKVSSLNPQTEFGGDVLSRIAYAKNNEDGTKVLKDSIVSKVNEMIRELTEEICKVNSIYRIIIAANTTMLHLFVGINPNSIAKAPYRSIFLGKIDIKADSIGVEINRSGIVTLLPSASSYVGADILAGIAATDFHKKEHSAIFIDIGTNGEIVVISKGNLAATSTAAGPALEGMNISCGCRAEEGAIDTFDIDENFNINFTTIGDAEAKGICGSGLIDVVASLVRRGIVLESGRFNKSIPEKVANRLKDKKFYITEDISISQKDIRQIQLAKGAIAAGVSMLLSELNISIEEVQEVVIAGAFGYHVNGTNIKVIGLIPKGFNGDISFVGNSSIEGARLALINRDVIKTIENFKDNIKVLELSTKDSFQDYFIKALSF